MDNLYKGQTDEKVLDVEAFEGTAKIGHVRNLENT